MKRDAYTDNNGIRRSVDQIRSWAYDTYDICLMDGFQGPRRMADVTIIEEPSGRVASFMEFIPRRAYYLREDSVGAVRWQSPVIPEDAVGHSVVLVFAMALGMGSALPQPSGYFELACEGLGSVKFCVTKYQQFWHGQGIDMLFTPRRVETCPPGQSMKLDDYITEEHAAAFGLGLVRIPLSESMRGKTVALTVTGHARTSTARYFKLDAADRVLWQADFYAGLDALMRGRTHAVVDDYNVYFGDIHTHSGQDNVIKNTGCGDGTIRENYEYARDVAGLDFYALTDHDWGIAPSDGWSLHMSLCDEYYSPGEFCTIPAYEWTSPFFGHRNVYFRGSENTACVPSTFGGKLYTTPEQLWDRLDMLGTDYITVPHHPSSSSHPFSPAHYNPRRDRLAEVYSVWGNSEYYGAEYAGLGTDRFSTNGLADMLDMGWKCGIVASSDGHDGHPGNAQSPGYFHPHQYHYLGSGRTAVLCKRLDRESVFEALKARRCYGTTGAPIILSFHLNGAMMGSELTDVPLHGKVLITADVQAPAPIEKIEIIACGQCVSLFYGNRRDAGRVHVTWQGTHENENEYYYVKIYLTDSEMAWSSPVFLTKAADLP